MNKFITGLGSNILGAKEYASNYLDFIQSKITRTDEKINDILYNASLDPSDPAQFPDIMALGAIFKGNVIRQAFDQGDSTVVDTLGRSFDFDEVIDDLADTKTAMLLQQTALESVVAQIDTDGDISSIWQSKIATNIGQISQKCSTFASFILQTIHSGAGVKDLVNTIFENDATVDGTRVFSIVSDVTGVSPIAGYVNSLDLPDLGNVGNAVLKGVAVVGNVIKGFVSDVASFIKKKVTAVVNTVSDPVDINYNEKWDDLSIDNAYADFSGNILISESIFQKFNEHRGEFLRFITIGATWYVKLSYETVFDAVNGTYLTIYLKRHIYSPQAMSQLFKWIAPVTLAGETYGWGANYALLNNTFFNVFEPVQVSQEYSQEQQLFKSFINPHDVGSVHLDHLYLGLNLILDSDGESNTNWVEQYATAFRSLFNDNVQDINPHILTCPRIDYTVGQDVSNYDWLQAATYTYQSQGRTNVINMLEDILPSVLDELLMVETFYPYRWVKAPIVGAYSIRTDNENVEALGNLVKTIVGTVIVLAAGVALFKVKKSLNMKALRATVDYENAVNYSKLPDGSPNYTNIQKLQKKMKRANKLAGVNYPAVFNEVSNSVSTNVDNVVKLIRGN